MRTLANAATPSPLPVKPRRSEVVADTVTVPPTISLMTRHASGRRAAFADFVTFPNFGQALLTSFLSALATIIGWVVTVPLVFLMSGYAYLRIQGRDAARWAR